VYRNHASVIRSRAIGSLILVPGTDLCCVEHDADSIGQILWVVLVVQKWVE
jgi:hypothetical protein